ncbi:unnamed protein product [Rhizopus microsporus]
MYRIIFDLANRIVSPKFARKLNYVSSLSQLAAHIKLDSKFIPQRVVEYDRQLPVMNQTSPLTGYSAPSTSLAFGRTLEELAGIEGKNIHGYIPKIVLQITNHIRKHGMDKEGIFRKSPSSEELRSVKKAYNQGLEVDLCQYDIDVSAALLKVFIRELPEPLISLSFSDKMGPVPDASICSQNTLDKIKASLREYYDQKPAHFQLLGYLCKFLKEVSENSGRNRMNIHNLSVVFTPNIIRAEEVTSGNYVNVPDNQHSALENATVYLKQMSQGMSLVELLIAKSQDIF